MRRLVLAWTVTLLALGAPRGARAQACEPARTALVLAGGGGKGFAHIGVLHVIDSIGVRPDLIVGTSIGAIIGALYASGYSAAQIDSLTRALPLESVIGSYAPRISSSMGLLRPAAVWELGESGYVLQSGAAREGEVNALMSALMLRGNLLARGNFDSLPIPFRAIATNVRTRGPVALARGDLARAVRASSAIPVVLRPVRLDGDWLTDGGIGDNVPTRFARQLGAERLWVSLLPFGLPDQSTFDDPIALSITLINSIFRADTIAPGPGDVIVPNPTQGFVNLDFSRPTLDSLIALGKRTARTAFAVQPCLRPLGAHRARAMPDTVRDVGVPSVTPSDIDALLDDLGLEPGTPLDAKRLESGIRVTGHADRYRALWLNPVGTGREVSFGLLPEPAPRRAFGVGVAFDQFMSGRLWFGGIDRSLARGDAEGVALVRLGSYAQDASVFVRRRARVRGRFVPFTVAAHLEHESVRRFEGPVELSSAETRELGGFVGLRQDPTPGVWRFELGFDSRFWEEPGRFARGGFGLRASLFRARDEHEMGTIAEALVFNDFQHARLDMSRVFHVASVETRLRGRLGWGHRLPLARTFALGGDDGFAGLRIGEVRGSQEAFASVRFRRRIAPILQLRVEGMAGAVGRGYGALVREDSTYYGRVWSGARVGFDIDTPLGPIRIEEGFSNDGRKAALFRVGYWF